MSKVVMNHGAGGEIMQEFLSKHIVSHFPKSKSDVPLDSMDDSAVVDDIVFTIDGHTVNPLIFPGGDIGRISVSGTVNDISVMGATPLALACSVILEEGLDIDTVDLVMESMGRTSRECGVPIVTGDTKVMETGAVDKMVISTSAIGKRSEFMDSNLSIASEYRTVRDRWCTDANLAPGDVIIASGYLGDHGVALLSFREGYGFESRIRSDVAPLNRMIAKGLAAGGITAMKDPTRGGLANTLNEWCSKSHAEIEVEQASIPLRDEVISACDLLGIDPLSIGNEGKVIIGCVPDRAEDILKAIRGTPEGRDASIIGTVREGKERVILKTEIGGRRILEPPSGDPVPRIC
ncbi:MAG: hydrogenase expression/formation protein HypE [Candidatus Methanoplasma sp.]|jgi:hydrogenase expression/formation protein HypE|nr:hydrogenase expression/formation protein HypE [Candidatus Methanoplasma sp.]